MRPPESPAPSPPNTVSSSHPQLEKLWQALERQVTANAVPTTVSRSQVRLNGPSPKPLHGVWLVGELSKDLWSQQVPLARSVLGQRRTAASVLMQRSLRPHRQVCLGRSVAHLQLP